MKWMVMNTFGAVSWLAGLFFTKQGSVAGQSFLVPDAHRPSIGLALCAIGLFVLVHMNRPE